MTLHTYTFTDDARDGTWMASATLGSLTGPLGIYTFPLGSFTGGWLPAFTLAAPGLDALWDFQALDSTDTILRDAITLSLAGNFLSTGSGPWAFDLFVVTRGIDAPSDTAIPKYMIARVGRLHPLAPWLTGGTIFVNLTLGAVLTTNNYTWTPYPGGLGAVNAAWRTFLPNTARELVFLLRHIEGDGSITFTPVAAGVRASLRLSTFPAESGLFRCPRCGFPVDPEDLIRDGYTRAWVCTQCYDPPTPPKNFRWPFVPPADI